MINNFALIIGAMKCGTTSLFKYLSQHPQISISTPKEPDFFQNDSNFFKGTEWYQGLWEFDSTIHKVALEGSTNYTKHRTQKVVERIFQIQQNFGYRFKFIYIVRDPIERIESHYNHALAVSWGKDLTKFDKGIDPKLIEITRYAEQVNEYMKFFAKDEILVLDFYKLTKDTSLVLRNVCEFLELDISYEFINIQKNWHPTNGKIMDGVIWPFVEPLTKGLTYHRRRFIREKLAKRVIKEKERLSQRQREFILKELKDDLHIMKEEYGVDINQWSCLQNQDLSCF
jgi:hypothetical protein